VRSQQHFHDQKGLARLIAVAAGRLRTLIKQASCSITTALIPMQSAMNVCHDIIMISVIFNSGMIMSDWSQDPKEVQ
jgi:hypothetical protein